MIEPTVEQYLIGTCLSIIDEFNILYEKYTWEQLKKAADEKYNEMDITVKVMLSGKSWLLIQMIRGNKHPGKSKGGVQA